MALLSLNSSNNKLSFIIKKNPNSGMQIREHRNGYLFGWYSSIKDANNYNIYFKDSIDKISYSSNKDISYDYMDLSKYNSSLLYNNIIKEFFNYNLNSIHEDDVIGFDNTIFINMIYLKPNFNFDTLINHLSGVRIEYKEIAKNNYAINICSNNTLSYLLNITCLLTLFISIFNGESLQAIENNFIEKYINILNKINAPYFIRYLLKSRLIDDYHIFNKYKVLLESSTNENIELVYGHSQQYRKDAIKNHLYFDNDILDIGFGDGFYIIDFASKVNNRNKKYYGIEIEPTLFKKVQFKVQKSNLKNVCLYDSFDSFLKAYDGCKTDVIIVEVIEHLPKSEAQNMLLLVADKVKFNKIIITTPNRSFNKYYLLNETVRHIGHIFEMDKIEFEDFINNTFDNRKYIFEFIDIGDRVNNISSTMGCIISNK